MPDISAKKETELMVLAIIPSKKPPKTNLERKEF